MDLDNKDSWKALDSLGIEKSLGLFLEQLREAWEQSNSVDLPVLKPKSVVISGMGGSALAGRIIAGAFESVLPFPIYIHNDYGLPSWVDKNTLVIANSYSGNTEETISGIENALNKGLEVLGITTGGAMREMIENKRIKGVILNPTTNFSKFPKSGLGVSLGGLVGMMDKVGLMPQDGENFEKSVEEVEAARVSWLPESPTAVNPAKQIAGWIKGSVPILFASRPTLGGLHAGRNVINEIGRTFSTFFDLPELDHHLVEGSSFPLEAKSIMKYLLFTSSLANDRVKLRYKITERLFKKQSLEFKTFELQSKSALAQSIEVAHFCAWVAFYLSMLNGEDPGPEPWIIELKNEMSQPVH